VEKENLTMYALSQRSLSRLEGVHPDLVRVVKRAITMTRVDFSVLEGVRTEERQLKLFEAGASTTMRSRHIPKKKEDGGTGLAHAVDLGAYVDGETRWDWPLYDQIGNAMKMAALEEDVKIEWGGDWKSFRDGPHFQLPWAEYPA
jgi:peptidoglycan L-alanyl-D-glutamate endopeptidase CwlK